MITEKEHIHTLTIRLSGEQQLFQVKLPKNAKKITGILITTQPFINNARVAVNEKRISTISKVSTEAAFKQTLFSVKTGDIKLRLNNRKNIFYADDVCAFELLPDYEKLIGIKKVGFDDGSFGTQGTQIIPLKVEIETKDTIIDGSYKDTMPIKKLFPYHVNIYITYEIEE